MGWFIVLVGIFWVVLGISGLISSKKTTLMLCNFVKNAKRQTLGLISLIFGALLLISASSAKTPWFVLALGIFACLKGITIVLMPEKSLRAMVDWWLVAPEIVYKWWAALVLILGIAMIYIR